MKILSTTQLHLIIYILKLFHGEVGVFNICNIFDIHSLFEDGDANVLHSITIDLTVSQSPTQKKKKYKEEKYLAK